MNILKSINYTENGITSKVIYKGENNQITLFSMAAGTDISEHTSTKEGYVYVLEGKGIFNLEQEKIHMKPGKIIQLKKNIKHSLSAQENTSYLLFLSK